MNPNGLVAAGVDDLPDVDLHPVERSSSARSRARCSRIGTRSRGASRTRPRARRRPAPPCRAPRRTAPPPTSVDGGVHAADDLRDGAGREVAALPGSSRSGENASRKSAGQVEPAPLAGSGAPPVGRARGRWSTRARRAARGGAAARSPCAVLWMYELSGSRCGPSGVGTQMTMASHAARPVEVGRSPRSGRSRRRAPRAPGRCAGCTTRPGGAPRPSRGRRRTR